MLPIHCIQLYFLLNFSQGNKAEYGKRKPCEEQRSLHLLMMPQIAKLCEILHFPVCISLFLCHALLFVCFLFLFFTGRAGTHLCDICKIDIMIWGYCYVVHKSYLILRNFYFLAKVWFTYLNSSLKTVWIWWHLDICLYDAG